MKRQAWWAVLSVVVLAGLTVTGVTSARSFGSTEGAVLDGDPARDVASTVWFQGFLADVDTGDPINATHNMVARIFNVAMGGSALWGPETHNAVTITEGWFNIELGSSVGPLPDFDSPPYYVELTIDGEVLAPRLKLASVPSALRAGSMDNYWAPIDEGIVYYDTVAIGTYYPDELLTIRPVNMGEDAIVHFVPRLLLDGEKGDGRYGEGTIAGIFDGDVDFYMVNMEDYGDLWLGGGDYPGCAVTDSGKFVVSPWAYVGWEPPGALTVDVGAYGAYGAAFYSAQEYEHMHTVHAEYYGSQEYATAVYGDATAGDQWTAGGEFHGNGRGVSGYAEGNATPYIYGIYGDCDNGTSTATCYSIYGSEPTGNGTLYAGYFSGNASVTGTLSKGAGSFKIDHPLDPENMYLQHSFVESPDMMNVYNGNVVLDGAGEATVVLPDYFEVLNRDFRYQLTPIGAPGPNLYIASEIAGDSFRIAGGEPGSKVSWQVTGVREDRFAEANRIVVELPKTGDEVGRYAHPEAYGLPKTMSIDYHEEMETARAAAEAKNEEISAGVAAQRAQAKARAAGQTDWRKK